MSNTPSISVINCFQSSIKERQDKIQCLKTLLKNEEDNLETMIATLRELEEEQKRSLTIKRNNAQSALRIRFHEFLDRKSICPTVRENIKSLIIFFPEISRREKKLLMETHNSCCTRDNNFQSPFIKLTMNIHGDKWAFFSFGEKTNSEINEGCNGNFIVQEESVMFENILKYSVLFE